MTEITKKVRSDHKKREQKIKTLYAKYPLETDAQIAKRAGVSRTTVARVKANLNINETKSNVNLTDIANKDREIILKWQRLIEQAIDEAFEKAKTQWVTIEMAVDVVTLTKESMKRMLLFERSVENKVDSEITIKIEY